MKMLRGPLISIGIAVLTQAAMGASGAPEQHQAVAATATPAVSNETAGAPGRLGSQQRNPRYQLCKADILELTFPVTPEFNQTVTVQPDGYITLTGLGDMHVAGKTVPEVRELLTRAYSIILHDPIVNVILKDFQKPYFIIGGEVAHPGKFEMRDDTSTMQAVAIAGGFTDSAKHSQVLLFRRVSSDWVEVKTVDVKKLYHGEDLGEDVHLQPGDMLFVPKSRIAKIRPYIPYPSLGMFFNPTQF